MRESIHGRITAAPVVAIIQAEEVRVAVATASALLAGGITVLEVVLRTDAAMDCLEAISDELSHAFVGAGTVLNEEQAKQAIDRGARFIVSPGLDDNVVKTGLAAGVDVFPGVSTPTEVQRAFNLGIGTMKFFPASIAGGVPMLRALGSVFRETKFIPTGGITAENLSDYLAVPSVVACGGSWLTPASAVKEKDYQVITRLARDAIDVARTAKAD